MRGEKGNDSGKSVALSKSRKDLLAGRFELEQLESRVLLSADILAASASLAGAVHAASEHKLFAAHETLTSSTLPTADHAAYNPADKVGGLFEGMTGEALTSTATSHHESGSQNETAALVKNAGLVSSESQAVTETGLAAETAALPGSSQQVREQAVTKTTSTQVQPSVPQTISATATTGASGGAANTHELTQTLKAANAPPVKSPVSQANPQTSPQDFESYIQQTLAGQSGSYSATVTLSSSLSIGGFIRITGGSLTFAATESNNVWSGTVSINATSGSVFAGQNFSATTGSITGTYYIGTVPQGKHQFSLTVNTFKLSVGQALSITSPTFSVTYDAGSGSAQTIATISNATASSPLFSGLPTATLTNFKLGTDGFSFDDFSLTATGPVTIGNFFKATDVNNAVSLSISDFNLSFADPTNSTGSVSFTADNIQLFPNVGFLHLQFANLHGTFDLINTTTVNSVQTSVIGSGVFSLAISGLDISVGEALTVHVGDVTLNPGQATVVSVTDATVTSNLLGGFGTFNLGSFTLTQDGFTLSNFSFAPTGTTVNIGNFASFANPSFNVNNFSLNNGVVSGSITFSGDLTLFPGNSNVNSSFTNLQAQFDFSSASKSGALTLTADSFSLTVDNQLTISANGITITPDQTTILQLSSFSVTLAQLNGLAGSITGSDMEITTAGFTIASATFTATNSNFNLGGVVSFAAAPSVTFTNIAYTVGGGVGGTVTLNPTTVTLSLGGAITASGTFSGDYNIKPATLNASINDFSLSLGGFVSVTGDNLVVSYQPASDGSAAFYIGGAGLTVLMGCGSGTSAAGVEVTDATFALAIFKAARPSTTITYAFDANGGISLVGLPANSVSFSATNVDVRANNAGSVDQLVNVDSTPADAMHLFFTANEQSFLASGLTLSVGNLVTITGDFGFQAFTDPNTSLTDVAIGASKVNAVLGTSTVNVTISDASLGLLILPGTTSNTYALVANGGVDKLNGVPGLSLSASGLSVKVNTTGLDPDALATLPSSVTTPDGSVPFDFTGLGAADVIAVEGSITLNVDGFISLSGDFGFQTFTDSNSSKDIIIGADNISATLGTATTYLSIDGASLQLVVVPGTGYSLVANGGTDKLNGVPGLEFGASNLSVKINTLGEDPASLGLPASVPTPDGPITIDFSSVGATNIKDIEGDLTLTVDGFVTLQGSFGFQAFTDSNTGLTDMAIGATGLTATLGTSDLNVQIDGASLGVLVIAGANGAPSTYALVANGGTDTLNGIPGLSFAGDGLTVTINKLGVDPSQLPGIPAAVHTSGGDVALDFTGKGSGALMDVEGTITLSVLNFVSLQGSFSFQTFTDLVSGKTDIAVGATNVNATLSVGGVSLTIDGASLGLVMLPGASNTSTYALVANGGTDTLTGIPGLSLSASGLLVRINNTGDDLTTRIGSTSISTPGGSVALDFSGLGTGIVKDIEGNISLTIANFVSLSGDFGFQQFTDSTTGTTEILVGGKNISATLGTDTTNVTINGASLGVLLLPGAAGNPGTYALVANGGDDQLNGVPGLSLSAFGLMVKVNNGVDSQLLADGAQVVHTSGGDVTLDFSALGAGNVIDVEGSVSLNIAGFVSLGGNFVFTKQISPTDPNVAELVAAATGVNAFLGTDDQSVGISVNDAEVALIIYQNITGHTTTYALHAMAGVQIVGLPTDIGFSGVLGVDINTTGAAVDETVTTLGGPVDIHFTDGTNGSADQRNIEAFSGSLTMSVGPQSNPLFSLTGDFSITKTVVNGTTELMIGATNVGTSNIIPDNNGGASVSLTGGSLGLIIFTKASGATTVNGGYALTASATVSAGAGSSSASLTVTIRRNTTTNAVDQSVTAGSGSVPVTFSSSEVAGKNGAFQSIALSNASLSIDNTLIITASSASSSSSGGVTTQTLNGVTLTLQDPDSGTVLFSITATSASYSTVKAGATFDGMKWVNGGKDVVLNNISLSIAGYVVFTGTVDIQHYTNASNAVVTSFNFTSASVSFLVNNKPMVTVAGTFAFSYSSATGFALSSATITDFSFLGQSLGGGVSANDVMTPSATQATPAAATTGTHTLGPLTLGTPNVSLSHFSLHLDGTLSVTVTISDPLASISGSVISAAAKNLSGSFDIGLQLNLANPLSAPTNITASGFTLKIGELDITLTVASNISLVLTATNITIDPTAGPTADLVSFGGTTALPGLSATLTVAAFQFTGGASNFAITGNGSFVAGNNFSVTLGFGASTGSAALQWPSWLPIQNVSITLTWPNNNFNTNPTDFLLDLSADINLNNIGGIPLTLQGTAKHVIIDVGKLASGEFPIVSIGALGVTVSGNLYGGTISGTLLAGIVRFDANGAVVDANGNLVSNGTPGVGPFRSVFYGGIDASFSLGNMSGFEIRIGLTQYGPLSIYMEGTLPDGIILDPDSGLAINNFRGGVTFGQGIPPINLSTPISATDALQLRQSGFNPPAQLTLDQWQTQLAAQVATLYKNGNNTDGWSNLGSSTITFQAGATLFDAYATENAFKVDADIFFDTSGKFLVIGSATFANSLTMNVKLYADLSPVFNGTEGPNNPVNILFLMDYPALSGPATVPPIMSIYGVLQFKTTTTGGFEIDIAGGESFNVMGGFQATMQGTVALTFTATSFQMTATDLTLSVSYLGNIGEGAGSLTIQKDGSGLDIWGAFLVNANLSALENVGIHAGGQLYFELNTTTQPQPVTLHLTSGDVPLTLQPTSFSFYISAGATFDLSGQQVFSISGALAVNLTIDTTATTPTFTLTIFVGEASLIIGPANAPLFNYTVNGLIYVDQNGFAAKMTLTYAGSPLSGFTIGENWLLVMNTTGENISFQIPSPTPGAPAGSTVAPIMGPDFSSSNVLATISYETMVNGHRTISIPDGAPPTGTTNFVTWTANTPNAYIILLGRGSLTVGSLSISGTLNLVAAYSPVTGLSFALEADAAMNLAVNGTTLFSFNVLGAIQINSSGLVAALTLSRSNGFNTPGGLGFTLSATFTLEINTTGSAVTVVGTSITVQPGALVAARGSLSIPGFSISGEFDLTVSPTNLYVYVNGTVNILGVTLNVQGYAGVYYDTDPGFALSLQLSVGSGTNCTIYPVSSLGNQFVIQGTLLLQINTCSGTRSFTDPVSNATTSIASGFVISVSKLNVYLFGLNLTGNAYFGITSGGLNIHLELSLSFFGCNFSFDGYVNSDGSFSITASASFEYDWSIKIFSGEVYAYLTITLSNSGFAASAGCGIHVDHIGSLSASASVFISGSEFKMDVGVDIGICDVTVHIDLGSVASPPAPPPTPALASQNGSILVLNLGSDVGQRGASFGPVADENYALTGAGGDITVTALGYSQTFSGVTEILVDNTYNASTTSVTISVASGITATEDITLGSINNNITTGGGYATIYDYGAGTNTINAGSGGGVYYGGTDGTNAYGSKGETTINSGSNFSVIESGYANYVLNSAVLQYGSYLLDLNGVNTVTLNAAADGGSHVFTILGWTGTVNINGQGSSNTINVNPFGGASAATFVLTNSSLQVTVGGVTDTYNLSDVQTANLTGDATGANTYTVTNWSGNGSITGPTGSTNTIIAVNNRDFTLTGASLARSGLPTLTLSNIQNANLTGGVSANTFDIQSWNGNVTLNGVGGNEIYDIDAAAVSGTITISDSAPNSNDVLNFSANITNFAPSVLITSSQLQSGSATVNYSGIQALNINSTTSGMFYDVESTNSTTLTTITSGANSNFLFNSAAGTLAPAGTLDGILGNVVLNGSGSDTLMVDDSGATAGRAGIMTPGSLDFTGVGTISFSGVAFVRVSLGQGADSFTIVDTISSSQGVPPIYVVSVDGNGGDDTFNVLATHASTLITGGDGNDTFNVFGNSSALTLYGNEDTNVFNLFAAVPSGQQNYQANALLTIDGGVTPGPGDSGSFPGTGVLNIYGTVLNDSIIIDGANFTSLGLDVTFKGIETWMVYGLGGDDTFYVTSVVVNTTLVGEGAEPAFTLPAGVNAPDLTGGATATSFNENFYIGWQGEIGHGTLAGINAPLTIQGNEGANFALVDDSADTVGQTFTLTPTTMNSTAMGASGQITYSGLATLNVWLGSGDDTLAISNLPDGMITNVTGGAGNNSASLNFTAGFSATRLTLVNFQTASLDVGGDFSGTLIDDGAFTTVNIVGSMTSGSDFDAGSIGAMSLGGDLAGLLYVTGPITSLTIGGNVTTNGMINASSMDNMTVGGDFGGSLNIAGLLNTLAITGGAPGKIVAGDINDITVQSGYGNRVLDVVEGGIERQIQAAPVTGGILDPSIRFAFMYDSSAAGDPQLAISITNNGAVTPHSFNLTLAVIGSDAQFNLALVTDSAATGLSNLTVTGDILFSANANELNFLGLDSAVGVMLPFDNITGVEVSGILPIGVVDVAGIEGVAFGVLENAKGQAVPILHDLGSAGKPQVLWNLLGSRATLLAATDALTVSFNANHPIEVFAQSNSDFTLEYAMTLTDQFSDGAPITGSIQIAPGKAPSISNIDLSGNGAAIDSRFAVSNLTSTGYLGDVTIRGKAGLGNLTADGILGNMKVMGSITGTIESTGGEIGQFTYGKNGDINGVTTILVKGGISGQIIANGGSLISTVKSGTFSGVIAVYGDIGVWVAPSVTPPRASATEPTRYGGISISGNYTGQIIALQNDFGDINITGTLTGQIAVQGETFPSVGGGGILGNVHIGKFAAGASIVSGEMIGDAAIGTAFKSGPVNNAVVAADGDINFAKGTKVNVSSLFANSLGTPSGAAIDAIFTNNHEPLEFSTGGPLAGLALVEADLNNLAIIGGVLAGTTP